MRDIGIARTRAAAIVIALLLGAGCGAGERKPAAAETDWRTAATSPLAPREGALALWTGDEVLVLGGSDARPCPPNAYCAPPETPPLADGAAYAPATDRWRELRDAPVPFSQAQGAVLGGTAYVLSWSVPGRPDAEGVFLAYRIATDTWEELPPPTPQSDVQYQIVPAGERLVAFTHDSERILVFDVDASAWRPLPPDPLGRTTGRVVAWSGRELVLFGHTPVPNPNSKRPWHPHTAGFDFGAGTWRRLPDSPLLQNGPWFASGDGRLVNPTLGGADGGETNNWGRTVPFGGILDPSARRWSELPSTPMGDDQFSAGVLTPAGAHYYGRSGWVLDLRTDRWFAVPRFPGDGHLSGYSVVAAGDDLFVFGGARWSDGSRGELSSAARLWSPER